MSTLSELMTTLLNTAIAIQHFETESHSGANISSALEGIFAQYEIRICDTPFDTDHGSNIVNALEITTRIDCAAHRLHTTFSTA